MRRLTSIVLAGAISASSAFAADNSPLAAGKPAGVQKAELEGRTGLMLIGLAIVAGGIALVCSEGSGNNITSSTNNSTTGTTTTGTTTTGTTATTTTTP